MAVYVLKNCKHYVGSYDLSGFENRVKASVDINMLETTASGATYKTRIPGMTDGLIEGEGYLEDDAAATIGDYLPDRVGGAAVPVTVCPTTGVDGERAFFMNALIPKFDRGYTVGDLVRFTVECRGAGPFVRGLVLAEGDKSSTGAGTARVLGAATATQTVYAAIHCTAVTGTNPTCTVKVQCDTVGFASPTDVFSFDQLTGIGNEYKTKVGPYTETYWRLYWTVGGTSPHFTLHGVVGIL